VVEFMTRRGVIYCATNHVAYFEAALTSAIVLRHLNPELPITIVCDSPIYCTLPLHAYGIFTIVANPTLAGNFLSRSLKTQLNHFSPYEETLYLDSDILPMQPITPIWDYLASADCAMVVDRMPTIADCDHIAVAEKAYTLATLPGRTTQFNSGVMLWRKNHHTTQLFQQWQREWSRFQKHDQLALVRALAQTQLSVARLPVNYNISPIDAAPSLLPKKEVYFLHCWGGQVASGAYRQTAASYYPKIVEIVTTMLTGLGHDCARS
jgi:Nucleotide-diphospho-sugar transferase